MIKPNRVISMTSDEDLFQNGTLQPSTVASQYVEEMIDIILVVNGHLCGTLCTQHWVVDLILIHPSQTAVCGPWLSDDLRLCVRLLMSTFLSVSFLLLLWSFVSQNLFFVDSAVHHKHGSVLCPVFLMSLTVHT